MSRNILYLGDIHAPAFDWDAVAWAGSLVDQLDIDRVVQVGDLIDGRAWSRFDQDPDFSNPSDELEDILDSCHYLHRIFPQLTVITGNHDLRWMKRAFQCGLPRVLVKQLHEVLPFKGWHWHLEKHPLKVGNTYVIHGDEMPGTPALKAAKLGGNLVQGHNHQGSIEYVPMFDKLIWGASAGCLIDQEASNFRYVAANPRRCFIGVLAELDGEPHLLAYPGEGNWK
jgi:hypothetical protein